MEMKDLDFIENVDEKFGTQIYNIHEKYSMICKIIFKK